MHTDDPLRVTGAGFEFIEGFFLKSVTDRARLARRIYSFCPDFVDQGIGLEQTGVPHALIELYFAASGVPTDRFSRRQRLE